MGPDPQAPPASSDTPDARATTFQPIEGGPQQHNGSTLMVEAYALIWTLLAVWVLLVWRKNAALNTRLDELEREIDKAAAAAEKKKS